MKPIEQSSNFLWCDVRRVPMFCTLSSSCCTLWSNMVYGFENDSNWIDPLRNKYCKRILKIMIRWRRWWRQSRRTIANDGSHEFASSQLPNRPQHVQSNRAWHCMGGKRQRGTSVWELEMRKINATYRHTQWDRHISQAPSARTSSASSKKSIIYF